MDADVIVVGAGLAGLVVAHELTRRGRRVALVEQENSNNLGGQAYWSLGGVLLIDSPEQRRMGIRDSFELAWNDWRGSAAFDRLDDEDYWANQWARAYVEFASGEKRGYLVEQGISFLPTVGWAERGDLSATGHGNSVPRFHVAWGAGTGLVEPFVNSARHAASNRTLAVYHRHQVDDLVVTGGTITGVRGTILAPDDAARGVTSRRTAIGDFELSGQAVVVTTGGIGANHDMVRKLWPSRLGTAPKMMLSGVPAHVDGRMLDIAARADVRLVNRDRMWHYTEGLTNWNSVWPNHGIRILPGPTSLWFDALGRRLPAPFLPGCDTLGTLRYLRSTPEIAEYSHSWFILNQRILKKEFALSGSEQNPDITSKSRIAAVGQRLLRRAAPQALEDFKEHGVDFVVADDLEGLVTRMNAMTDTPLLDVAELRRQIEARDMQLANPFTKDGQIQGIRNSRKSFADRLGRTVAPHRILDPAAGPLIGVMLHVVTRKTLGGIQTDLNSRALGLDGRPVPGLYAAGEVAGFGGGGVHGYNALEGTFLGGCIFSGRVAAIALADQL